MSPATGAGEQVAPPDAGQVQVQSSDAGDWSVTVAPGTSSGPALEATMT